MTPEYLRWNDALASYLLHGPEGEPFFVYVDRGVLDEAADLAGMPQVEDVRAEFSAAVAPTCTGEAPFRRWRATAQRWEENEFPGPPPFLAVLALSVLAASERSTVNFQYYDDLYRLLRTSGRKGMPKDFDVDVPGMFRVLNSWLSRHRGYGLPTASSHEHYPHIGWPLSQALLRPADGRELRVLMARAGLKPQAGTNGSVLRARVMPHIRLMAQSASRARLLDAESRFPRLLEDRLVREYRAWDGTSSEPNPEHKVVLRLAHEDGSGDWWFVARRPPGTDWQSLSIGGWTTRVRGRGPLQVEHPDPWSLVGSTTSGLVDGAVPVTPPSAGPKWLRVDRDAGGWVEQAARTSDLPHLRLLPSSSRRERGAWTEAGATHVPTAPDGWTLLMVPPGLEADAGDLQEADDGGVPFVMIGGFLLDSATATYLSTPNGLPSLVLSPGTDSVVVDEVHDVSAGSISPGVLTPGDHVLEASGHRRRVRVVRRLREDLDVPIETAWTHTDGRIRLETRSDARAAIAGALADDDDLQVRPSQVPVPVTQVWIVGEEGEAALRDVRPLPWLKSIGIAPPATDVTRGLQGLDFEPKFAIAFTSATSAAWVSPVHGAPSSHPQGRGADPKEVRRLVERLLTGQVTLTDPTVERVWRKSVARLMQQAHSR